MAAVTFRIQGHADKLFDIRYRGKLSSFVKWMPSHNLTLYQQSTILLTGMTTFLKLKPIQNI